MTKPPDDLLAQWRWQADRRWRAAADQVSAARFPEELVAQTMHEAIERYLKWFLLCRGWQLKRTHDLSELLDEAEAHSPALGRFEDVCERVNGYFVRERYPHGGYSIPTLQQLQADFAEADQLIKLLTAGN